MAGIPGMGGPRKRRCMQMPDPTSPQEPLPTVSPSVDAATRMAQAKISSSQRAGSRPGFGKPVTSGVRSKPVTEGAVPRRLSEAEVIRCAGRLYSHLADQSADWQTCSAADAVGSPEVQRFLRELEGVRAKTLDAYVFHLEGGQKHILVTPNQFEIDEGKGGYWKDLFTDAVGEAAKRAFDFYFGMPLASVLLLPTNPVQATFFAMTIEETLKRLFGN